MIQLRVGTRGSELALQQTRWVVAQARAIDPSLTIEEVVIATHGDVAVDQRFDIHWPAGGFVGSIEQALAAGDVDFAVHSYKDLPTAETPGLTIAAVPEREAPHDVLVTRKTMDLDDIGTGFRIGTSSPRRAAQLRWFLGDVEIVPLRGNVPTRLQKLEQLMLDGVVLAAAGLRRLGIEPAHRIYLPLEQFVPAPGQGALAIQTRVDCPLMRCLVQLDHPATSRAVAAERAFLRAIQGGCHVPLGAFAAVHDPANPLILLRGQLFNDEGTRIAEGLEPGTDPLRLGVQLAERLMGELKG